MGVRHAADSLKGPVKLYVGGSVGRGLIAILQGPARFHIHRHHHFAGQFFIGHAAGLDDENAPFPVQLGNVSPGVNHQSPSGQLQIRLAAHFLELFDSHTIPSRIPISFVFICRRYRRAILLQRKL